MALHAHHKLSDLAADRINDLLAEGIEPTPAEIVMLNALAWELESPRHRSMLARGVPVFAGRVALWPLTLAAEAWWNEATKHAKGNAEQMILLGFAMAHARNQDVLDATPIHEAVKHAEKWCRTLRVRAKELSVAIDEVLAQDEDLPRIKGPKDKESTGLTAAQLVAILSAATGIKPDVWEREVAVGYLREQLRAVAAQQAADNGGSLKDSDMVAATRQIALYIEEIRKRAAGGANGPNN